MKKRVVFAFLICMNLVGFCQAQEVFDSSHIHEIKINFEEENWAAKLKEFKEAGEGERLLGDLLIDDVDYKNVGVRYKGNSSYNFIKQTGSTKLPFNIKINYVDKEQKLPGKVKTLKLANGFRDPSFIREILAYDIARKYMHASRASFAKVFVNDIYLGLYTLVESIDNAFLDQHYGGHKGTLVKCDPDYQYEAPDTCPKGDRASLMYLGKDSTCYMGYYEMQSDHGWGDLIELIDILNNDMGRIEEVLDVDQTLWMLAFNNYLVNLDSYLGAFCHNYYLYKDEQGIFHPIVWDMNLAFGGFRLPDIKSAYSDEQLKKVSMLIHFKDNNNERPLLTNLLRNETYRKVYLAHIKTIVEDQALDSLFYRRTNELMQLVEAEVQEDQNKFYSDDFFEASLHQTQRVSEENIIGIMDLMNARHKYLNNHVVLKREAPGITNVNHDLNDGNLQINTSIGGAQSAWLCYRMEGEQSFKRIPLEKGAIDEADSNQQIWSTNLEYQAGMEYYIIAEGQYNASLSPRRASYEFYKVE